MEPGLARMLLPLAAGPIVYWTGHLATDRVRSDSCGEAADRAAVAAWTLAVVDGAIPVQRRLGPDRFEYRLLPGPAR